jgi:hypothetical protein
LPNEAFYITGSSYTSTPAFLPPERGAARLAAAMEAFMRKHRGTLCATPERWRRSMPTKTSKSKTSESKPNALQKPLQPSEELAAVVGTSPLPRSEVVSKIWEYIRSHNLQNPREPPRDPGGRQAHEHLWHGQGDHVRDEQAPHPTSEVKEPG